MTGPRTSSFVWDAGSNQSFLERRVQALFSGAVQGVGFRFTTERIARRYPVTGYVRNLPTGQVELLAEGEEKSLEDFLKAIREAFLSSIRNVETGWGAATGEYETFGIKF